jgi:hypothetical protein
MVTVEQQDKRVLIKTNNFNVYNPNFFNTFGLKSDFTPEKDGVLIEATSETVPLQTFSTYLANLAKQPKKISTFSNSGLGYIELMNIVNDLVSCVNFFRSKGLRLLEKKRDFIYVIHGRFVFITDELKVASQEGDEQNILDLICEICDKKYTRDEPLFMEIKGTMLHKILSELQNA